MTLTLEIKDLNRMKKEFFDVYETLFQDALVKLKAIWILKLKAIAKCREFTKRMKSLKSPAPHNMFSEYQGSSDRFTYSPKGVVVTPKHIKEDQADQSPMTYGVVPINIDEID